MSNLSRLLWIGFLSGILQAFLTLEALGFVVNWSLMPAGGGLVRWELSAFVYLMGALVLGTSFAAGYAISDGYDAMRSIPVSQSIAVSLFIFSVTEFPSLILPAFPSSVVTNILSVFPAAFLIYGGVSFLLSIVGNFLGFSTAERLFGNKQVRPRWVNQDKILFPLLLLFLSLSIALPIEAQVGGLQSKVDLNVPWKVVDGAATWGMGVENTSVDLGPIPKGSGYMLIDWNSNRTTTFNIVIFHSLVQVRQNGGLEQPVSFATFDDSTVLKAWFHHDDCSPGAGCPAGLLTYDIQIFY